MRWEQQIQYASISDIGFRRRNNQDRCLVHVCAQRGEWERRGHMFLVCDGMGGHAVGELASKIAADTLPHSYYKSRDLDVREGLRSAIELANSAIHERAAHNRDFERMGTTCTALVLCDEGAVVGHVGDSRVYRVRDGRIEQLSFDHSLQWELIRQGGMTPEEVYINQPRNVITRSLGPETTVNVDVEGPHPIRADDIYLLCSDGLTGHVNDAEIGCILTQLPPGKACRLLVHLANLRGGSDNITVVVAKVGPLPAGITPPPPTKVREPEPAVELEWWHWAGIWGVAALFVLAATTALLGNLEAGALLVSLSAGGAAALLLNWWSRRPRNRRQRDSGEPEAWRPYRSASAEFNEQLLTHLAAVEAELQRTATEEGWSINWDEHERAFGEAKSAIAAKEFHRAFRSYSETIDVLMAGVQLHRKQMNREAKWGKSAPSAPQQAGAGSGP